MTKTRGASHYQVRIATMTAASPRYVEAWMRLEHSTLDGLSAAQFREEVRVAEACIAEAGAEQSERLAESYGL